MELAGGTLANPEATEQCQYCAVASTNTLLASVNVFYDDRWRNVGFLWIYICFNTAATIFLYWLLRVPKQWRKVLRVFSPKLIEELH